MENCDAHLHKKSTSSLTSFLRYYKEFCNLVTLGNLGRPDHIHQDSRYQLVGQFDVYLHAKNQLHLSLFLRYCKDIIKLLFYILWTCLAMTSKNDTTSLLKTLMFIFMQKNHIYPSLPS